MLWQGVRSQNLASETAVLFVTTLGLSALLMIGSGCTAGTMFIRPPSESLVLGKTTPGEISSRLGTPYREATNIQEGKVIKSLVYSYAVTIPYVPTIPAKTMAFHFADGILVGYDFLSSFEEDKTDFDESRVEYIKKGETGEARIVELFGAPGGRYIYPMVKEPGQTALVYQYVRVDRIVSTPGAVTQSARKNLRVTLGPDGKVADIALSTTVKP